MPAMERSMGGGAAVEEVVPPPAGCSGRPVPRVTIGVPVFNGEAYLEEALRSIAEQSFAEYEVVISDNASTDSTPRICEAHAARDPRIRYSRSEVNIGGDRNWNRAFELGQGDYFLGVAHDDRLEPEYVARAVAVLDTRPEVVFCHSRTRLIDERGARVAEQPPHAFSDSPSAHVRLRDAICDAESIVVGFGMARSAILRQTPLFKPYPSSDAFLQAELALRGRLYEIPEILFERRTHAETGHAIPLYERLTWSAPEKRSAVYFPSWRRIAEYLGAIRRVRLPWTEKARCVLVVAEYCRKRRVIPQLLRDLRMAARRFLFGAKPARRARSDS